MSKISSLNISDIIHEIYKDDSTGAEIARENYRVFKEVLSLNLISLGFPLLEEKSKGYLAGGIARWILFSGKSHMRIRAPIDKYSDNFSTNLLLYYFNDLYGDIDIFFPEKSDFEDANSKVSHLQSKNEKSIESHTTDSARTWVQVWNDKKILCQYITHLYGSPTKVLESFDITNCRVAIDLRTNTVWIDEALNELESSRTLSLATQSLKEKEVVNRVFKYCLKHHYTNIDRNDGSLNFFAHWCHEKFSKENLNYSTSVQKEKLIQLMYHSSLINIKDLSLLIGIMTITDKDAPPMYKLERTTNSYGFVDEEQVLVDVKVDVAMDALKKRSVGKKGFLKGSLNDKPEANTISILLS
jgi:hypothetical protein